MGAAEEIGKVASTTIDALKTQPMLLALLLLQFVILGVVVYSSTQRNAAHAAQFHEVFTLLSKCMEGRQ